ncbi:trypsin-like peptidase domain-containing protein [Thermodesulfobacteriota bacterium]
MTSDETKNPSSKIGFLYDAGNREQVTGLESTGAGKSAVDDLERLATGIGLMQQREAGLVSIDKPKEREMPDLERLERTIGKPDFLPAWFLQIGAKLARTVCKIQAKGVDYSGRPGNWCGTGFMVSPDVMLTNHHVLNSAEVAGNSICIFDYQTDEHGKMQTNKSFRFDPDRLFFTSLVTDGGLDFTFVWVKDQPGREGEFGHVNLDRAYFKILGGGHANIVQHPNGEPKSVVLQANKIVSQTEAVVHYLSDTEGGSSGSCVFNKLWKPTALHHASHWATPEEAGDHHPGVTYVNEGIKMSAIATFLENVAQSSEPRADTARELLDLFGGTDSAMGFFGALGRIDPSQTPSLETVVASYRGEATDIDVGFWNVEWFTRNPEKVADVAKVVADTNLDIWAFEAASPGVTELLVEQLRQKFGLDFKWAASEPGVRGGKQTTIVIWNEKTVTGERMEWSDELKPWFDIDSRNFGDLQMEAVEGKVYNRYPGLFYFKAESPSGKELIDFNLVPLHLKAGKEGSKRRIMAARILGAAMKKMMAGADADRDWIIGGDFNAPLATKDFDALFKEDMVAVSAADEKQGAFTYLKGPKSLIDHVFLSANLAQTFGEEDFFVVAKEKTIPDYVERLSDHRPVLVRLSLRREPTGEDVDAKSQVPSELSTLLADLPPLT